MSVLLNNSFSYIERLEENKKVFNTNISPGPIQVWINGSEITSYDYISPVGTVTLTDAASEGSIVTIYSQYNLETLPEWTNEQINDAKYLNQLKEALAAIVTEVRQQSLGTPALIDLLVSIPQAYLEELLDYRDETEELRDEVEGLRDQAQTNYSNFVSLIEGLDFDPAVPLVNIDAGDADPSWI